MGDSVPHNTHDVNRRGTIQLLEVISCLYSHLKIPL